MSTRGVRDHAGQWRRVGGQSWGGGEGPTGRGPTGEDRNPGVGDPCVTAARDEWLEKQQG